MKNKQYKNHIRVVAERDWMSERRCACLLSVNLQSIATYPFTSNELMEQESSAAGRLDGWMNGGLTLEQV